MNSIYERKGLDVLLRAYWQAFSKRDAVELVIKSYQENDRPLHATKYVEAIAAKYGITTQDRAPVNVIDAPMSDQDVPGFMKSFDAVVSTHRSEGFGLTPFYAMALGIPVIATDHGGVTDFCREDTAWLVEVEAMVKAGTAETKIFDHLDGVNWAEPSVDSATMALRECLYDSTLRADKAEKGRALVTENFSYGRVGSMLMSALEYARPGFADEVSEKIVVGEKYGGTPFKMIEL
jgi:glycosyltransferase involved in cell wall biosynthesis